MRTALHYSVCLIDTQTDGDNGSASLLFWCSDDCIACGVESALHGLVVISTSKPSAEPIDENNVLMSY